MKKALIIFAIVVVTLGVTGGVVYISLNNSSRAFVKQNVPEIISSWDKSKLANLASSDYLSHVSDEQMAFDFRSFSRLGALKSFDGIDGSSFFVIGTRTGKIVTANYTADATFQNGDAQLIIGLIQESGGWKISRFVVNSPLFKDQMTFQQFKQSFPSTLAGTN